MPHNICNDRGRQSMMYVGEVPWHGLGTSLDSPPTAQQAIEAANLNWKVVMKPLYIHGKPCAPKQLTEDSPVRFKDFYTIVREDRWGEKDCPIFGMVSGKYVPLQNSEAFSFFDPIIKNSAATYETAGALGDGERVWVMAKIKDSIQVVGDDVVDRYLLLSNSHDGNSSVQVKFTPVRVVCQNTLTMALTDGPSLRVSHTKDMHRRLDDAQLMFSRITSYYNSLAEAFQSMAQVQMDTVRLAEYLSEVYPAPRDTEDRLALELAHKQRQDAEEFFDQGKGNKTKGVTGTLWAAYNGVTELVDHGVSYASPEKRLASVMFGDGYYTKARAFRIAERRIESWRN